MDIEEVKESVEMLLSDERAKECLTHILEPIKHIRHSDLKARAVFLKESGDAIGIPIGEMIERALITIDGFKLATGLTVAIAIEESPSGSVGIGPIFTKKEE